MGRHVRGWVDGGSAHSRCELCGCSPLKLAPFRSERLVRDGRWFPPQRRGWVSLGAASPVFTGAHVSYRGAGNVLFREFEPEAKRVFDPIFAGCIEIKPASRMIFPRAASLDAGRVRRPSCRRWHLHRLPDLAHRQKRAGRHPRGSVTGAPGELAL